MVQWIRIYLPMQRTQFPSLVWEAHGPQPLSPGTQSLCSITREATVMRSLRTAIKGSPRSPQPEKTLHSNKDPAHPKMNKQKLFLKSSNIFKKINYWLLLKRSLQDFRMGYLVLLWEQHQRWIISSFQPFIQKPSLGTYCVAGFVLDSRGRVINQPEPVSGYSVDWHRAFWT